jgi:predicted DNA-binding transcriptional regulator AlpA
MHPENRSLIGAAAISAVPPEIAAAAEAERRLAKPAERFLRLHEILTITRVTDQTLRRWEAQKRFPRRIRLDPNGHGAVAWLASEVYAWIAERAASRGPVNDQLGEKNERKEIPAI